MHDTCLFSEEASVIGRDLKGLYILDKEEVQRLRSSREVSMCLLALTKLKVMIVVLIQYNLMYGIKD